MVLRTLVILLYFSPSVTMEEDRFLDWSSRKLVWSDFQPMVTPQKHDAYTTSKININYLAESGFLRITVENLFDKEKSWVKSECRTASLLKHEQVHFDISEYYTRVLRESLVKFRFTSFRKLGNEIDSIFYAIDTKLDSTQTLYDFQTDHSKNLDQQKSWDSKVDSLLKTKSEYISKTYRLECSHWQF